MQTELLFSYCISKMAGGQSYISDVNPNFATISDQKLTIPKENWAKRLFENENRSSAKTMMEKNCARLSYIQDAWYNAVMIFYIRMHKQSRDDKVAASSDESNTRYAAAC